MQKKLTKPEIRAYFADNYDGDVRDMICVCWGLSPKSVEWEKLKRTNSFPYRQYETARQSIEPHAEHPLPHRIKKNGNTEIIWVKRDSFMEWASKVWKTSYPDGVGLSLRVWEQYKGRDKKGRKGSVLNKVLQLMDEILSRYADDDPEFFLQKMKDARLSVRKEIISKGFNEETVRNYIRQPFEESFSKQKGQLYPEKC